MAHTILNELHRDHINTGRLLALLDSELAKLPGESDVDLALMIDIVDYVENYPDLVHHPKEDFLYNAYKAISLEGEEIVDELLDQHKRLPELTKVFRQLLEEVSIGAVIISRNALYNKARDYVDSQRAHLNTEESLMFPMILNTFKEADWQSLAGNLPVQKDPLFDATIDRYNNLLEHLQKQEAAPTGHS